MSVLRALTTFFGHQVAFTLKQRVGLDYLSFDDLYNKLRTLEIDVKGGSSYDSRGTSAPTHSAFISAASTNSKMKSAWILKQDHKGEDAVVTTKDLLLKMFLIAAADFSLMGYLFSSDKSSDQVPFDFASCVFQVSSPQAPRPQ
ncbi:hypothetical protein Tco_0039596 [Tanacetum coccineum]